MGQIAKPDPEMVQDIVEERIAQIVRVRVALEGVTPVSDETKRALKALTDEEYKLQRWIVESYLPLEYRPKEDE